MEDTKGLTSIGKGYGQTFHEQFKVCRIHLSLIKSICVKSVTIYLANI